MSKPKTVLAIDTSHSNYSLAIINSNSVLSEVNIVKEEKPSEKLIDLLVFIDGRILKIKFFI